MSTQYTFDQYGEKARDWVRELAAELSLPEEKAYRIIRVVLHSLRNHIPIAESFHLIAQLPLVWKGIYVDGWKPSQEFIRLGNMADYIQSIRHEDKNMSGYDFGNDTHARKAIFGVWKLLANHVSDHQITHICNTLPNEVSKSIRSNINMTIL